MAIVGYRFYGRNIRPYLANPKKKRYTILGMTLFSLVVFGAFAIRPSLFTISRLNREVKKAREAEQILDQKIDDLSQAQVNYQLALKDLELIDNALPKDAAVPTILETLALTAGRNNVTLNEGEFGEATGSNSLKTLSFTIVVGGQLDNIEKFLTELESGTRQIDIGQVKIRQSSVELGYMLTEVDLTTHFLSSPPLESENE